MKPQEKFLTAYSFYLHSQSIKDPDRQTFGRNEAVLAAQSFIGEDEGKTEFEPALRIARSLLMGNGPKLFIETEAEFEIKPKKLFASSELSKSDVLSEVSIATGVKEERRLIASLVHARSFCTKEGNNYIYTQETVNIAAKFLKP